jgi:hypothetical protein
MCFLTHVYTTFVSSLIFKMKNIFHMTCHYNGAVSGIRKSEGATCAWSDYTKFFELLVEQTVAMDEIYIVPEEFIS